MRVRERGSKARSTSVTPALAPHPTGRKGRGARAAGVRAGCPCVDQPTARGTSDLHEGRRVIEANELRPGGRAWVMLVGGGPAAAHAAAAAAAHTPAAAHATTAAAGSRASSDARRRRRHWCCGRRLSRRPPQAHGACVGRRCGGGSWTTPARCQRPGRARIEQHERRRHAQRPPRRRRRRRRRCRCCRRRRRCRCRRCPCFPEEAVEETPRSVGLGSVGEPLRVVGLQPTDRHTHTQA